MKHKSDLLLCKPLSFKFHDIVFLCVIILQKYEFFLRNDKKIIIFFSLKNT